MSGAEIAREVAAALREAGAETGAGPLVATITPTVISGNPWDAPSSAPASVSVVVVVDQFRRDEIDGARIMSGDKKLMIEPGVIVPRVGDRITVSAIAHRIEMVMPLAPAGVDLMYVVAAREL